MDNKELRTIRLSWTVVEKAIQAELKKLLGINIECKASADSWDYWSVVFKNVRLNVEQLKVLFKAFKLSERDKQRSMPETGKTDTNSVDVSLAEKLLERNLGYSWEQSLADSALFLIGVDDESFILDGVKMSSNCLLTQKEVLEYLKEQGANKKALVKFHSHEKKKYNSLYYWDYPKKMYDDRGMVLILVKEGVMCLPCIGYDKTNGETYALEQALLMDASDMSRLIQRWWQYSDELLDTMYELKNYLQGKQQKEKGK